MTYGIPRPTAIKGNVTITSASRGLTKRDTSCGTCIESSNYPTEKCQACEKSVTPLPLVTLDGFDGGINGTFAVAIPSAKPFSNNVGGVISMGKVGIDFSGSSYCTIGVINSDGVGTIDVQWPVRAVNPNATDSTLLNGFAGLTCRSASYQSDTCYECGLGRYAMPPSLSSHLSIGLVLHNKPVTVEMGYRVIQRAAPFRPAIAGGGTWENTGWASPDWKQTAPARKFTLPAGVTLIIERRMDSTEYANGYRASEIGDPPNDVAVFHAGLSASSTATDRFGDPLLQCFGVNRTMTLIAKSEKSDSLIKNHKSVKRGSANSGTCQNIPAQTPPFANQQTGTYYNQVNDFGTVGTVTLSTSESILDIFLGDDFAAEIEVDASCTVTDG